MTGQGFKGDAYDRQEIDIRSDLFLAFLATSILIEMTPGPNMTYLAVLSASRGRRAGFAATLGVALGLLIVGAGTALGLATVIARSRFFYEALRWAGVCYLLWLAWEGWRDAAEASADTDDDGALVAFFWRGLATNLLNPKAVAFYVVVLPSFIDPSGPLLLQSLILSATYVGVATFIHAIIVLAAGAAVGFVGSKLGVRIRQALSLALAAIAVWFAVATAR